MAGKGRCHQHLNDRKQCLRNTKAHRNQYDTCKQAFYATSSSCVKIPTTPHNNGTLPARKEHVKPEMQGKKQWFHQRLQTEQSRNTLQEKKTSNYFQIGTTNHHYPYPKPPQKWHRKSSENNSKKKCDYIPFFPTEGL